MNNKSLYYVYDHHKPLRQHKRLKYLYKEEKDVCLWDEHTKKLNKIDIHYFQNMIDTGYLKPLDY